MGQDKAAKSAAPVKAPAPPPAPKPDAAAATRARTAVESYKKQVDQWTERAGKATGRAKEAGDNAVLALKSTIAAYEVLVKALEAGVAADVKSAHEAAAKAENAARRATDKAVCLERADGHLAPLPESVVKNTPDGAKPALDALVAAHKTAAQAWEKVAAAITPEADANAVEALRDVATGATTDTVIAARALTAASSAVNLKAAADRTGNPDAVKKMEEVKKLDAEVLALMRQQNDLALKLRKVERDRTAANVEFNRVNLPAPKAK